MATANTLFVVLARASHVQGTMNGLQLVLKKSFRSRFSARLIGYRVREIDSEAATATKVAVYIDFADGRRTWTTVASSTNIVKASVDALVDGYAYALRTYGQARKLKQRSDAKSSSRKR